jgi:NADPH2:quinone reductase
MKAVVMKDVGGTDVMEFVDRPEPVATPGHVVVEVAAAGVNFMDVGVRQGMAWTDIPNPKVLGVEGAGRVLAVGDGAGEFEVGDRVAWVYAPGSYAQRQSTERPHPR